MNTVILLVGPSGCGKSTKAKKYADTIPGSVIVSADYFFDISGEYKFDPTQLSAAHSYCQSKFLQAVKDDKPLIIVDNTNTTARERKFYISTAKNNGYKIMVDVLNVDPEVCAARNIHSVNKETVLRQSNRIDLKPGFYEV